MKRLFLAIVALMAYAASYAQVVNASTLNVSNQIKLRGQAVTNFQTDTFLISNNKVPTSKSVFDFVNGRISVNQTVLPLVKKDTLYYVFTGQSNSVGYATDQIDTAFTKDVEVFDSVTNKFVTMIVGTPPMLYLNSPSAQFYFGRQLSREKNCVVRIIQYAVGGQQIFNWHDGFNQGQYMTTLLKLIQNSKAKKIEAVVFDQGEADYGTQFVDYNRSIDSIKSIFRRQTYFSKSTPFVFVGMPQYVQNGPALSENQDWNLRSYDGNSDPFDAYANVDSATVNPNNVVHFNSKGLKYIGEISIPAALGSIPQSSATLNSLDSYGQSYFNGIQIGHGQTDPYKRFPTGTDSIALTNLVIAPTLSGKNKLPTGMNSNISGKRNIAISGLENNNYGDDNTNIGLKGMFFNIQGNRNINLGNLGLFKIFNDNDNVNVGYKGLFNATNSTSNNNIGSYGLEGVVSGSFNNNIGTFGLQNPNFLNYRYPTHCNNIGFYGQRNAQGSYNVTVGDSAGANLNLANGTVIVGGNKGDRIANLNGWSIYADGYGNEKFVVDNLGRMGINVPYPQAMLEVNGDIKANGSIITKAYTVATLPIGLIGMMTFVTDATSPIYLGNVAGNGGGTTVVPVFFNGSNWIFH